MESIPKEIVHEILNRIDRRSIHSAFRVCRLWQELVRDQITIHNKSEFKIACFEGDLYMVSRSFNSINRNWLNTGVRKSCEGDRKGLAEWLIRQRSYTLPDHDLWDSVLRGAARGGHLYLIEWGFQNGARDMSGIYDEACRGGHLFLVKWITQKGFINLCTGLRSAFRGGHQETIDWLISQGANHWDAALEGACRGGHLELAKWVLEKCTGGHVQAFSEACRGGHHHIVEWLRANGINFIKSGFNAACAGGHLDLAKQLYHYSCCFNQALEKACRKGHQETVEWLIEVGANYCRCDRSMAEHTH